MTGLAGRRERVGVKSGCMVALTVALGLLAGCGGDEPAAPPTGPMAEALDELGGGGDGSIGVSWADPQLVR